jgi:2,4-diketo-3-deoxy-L-fuconate hydrolase
MKLASIDLAGTSLVAVRVDDDALLDVNDLLNFESHGAAVPAIRSMRQIIEGGDELLERLRRAMDAVAKEPSGLPAIDTSQVRWRPPVPNPGKICAVAMNNSASNERKISAPDHPAFFLKPPSCLIGHGEAIRVRRYYGSVHPEPELAVVIGTKAHDVPASRALDTVFGYTIFNDVTGNGMRSEDMFHYWAVYAKKDNPEETERVEQHLSYAARYKGSDTFGVMGPWLVTKDDIANPDDLNVYCKIGDETIAEDSTRFYNYKVAEVISFISCFLTLHPGDVISLGTAFKPSQRRKSIHHANFQTVAGPVEIRIDGLGEQRSPVLIESKELSKWRLD